MATFPRFPSWREKRVLRYLCTVADRFRRASNIFIHCQLTERTSVEFQRPIEQTVDTILSRMRLPSAARCGGTVCACRCHGAIHGVVESDTQGAGHILLKRRRARAIATRKSSASVHRSYTRSRIARRTMRRDSRRRTQRCALSSGIPTRFWSDI